MLQVRIAEIREEIDRVLSQTATTHKADSVMRLLQDKPLESQAPLHTESTCAEVVVADVSKGGSSLLRFRRGWHRPG